MDQGENSEETPSVPSTAGKAFEGLLSNQAPPHDNTGKGGGGGTDDGTGHHGRPSKPPPAFVGLTYDKLDINEHINRVRRNKAGALVIFVGTTRDNFEGKQVKTLEYTTYPALALNSLQKIAASILESFDGSIHAISITHRLGIVPIGEDSIVIALSSSHRQEGWKAAEQALELVKDKVEIWKREWFVEGGVWRANRDGKAGRPEEVGLDS